MALHVKDPKVKAQTRVAQLDLQGPQGKSRPLYGTVGLAKNTVRRALGEGRNYTEAPIFYFPPPRTKPTPLGPFSEGKTQPNMYSCSCGGTKRKSF